MKQPAKIPTIILPKRQCANKQCGREIPVTSKYTTCSFRCHQAVQAELAAIDAADKAEEKHPF